MKKSLILASLLAFTMSTALANADLPAAPDANKPKPPCQGKVMPKKPDANKLAEKRAEFENKLQLTDEQKAQAKEIRQKGHDAMKPIMEQMKTKKAEIGTIVKSEISEEEKAAKIAPIKEELKTLKKQAKEIRIKNFQEFEAILTPEQKKTLDNMKKEGKKNFKKHHPKRPPCKCTCQCKNKAKK